MSERFNVGKVLGTGFRLWWRNLVPFLVISALVFSPVVVIRALSAVGGHDSAPSLLVVSRRSSLDNLLFVVATELAGAALSYGVVVALQGRRAPIGRSIGVGSTRLLPALGVTVATAAATVLGLAAFVLPGAIIYCTLYVAAPVSVLERRGVVAALRRSAQLTKDRAGDVLGLVLVLAVSEWGVHRLLARLVLDGVASAPLSSAAALGSTVVFGSINAVMTAAAYYHLRQEKEGTSADELARAMA